MSPDTLDLRTQRTHHVIRQAFVELVQLKGFDAITVGAIARQARINRGTFYRHFPDKYALAVDVFEEAIASMFSIVGAPEQNLAILIDLDPMEGDLSGPRMKKAIELLTGFFAYFRDHADYYATMLGRKGNSWFEQAMCDVLSEQWLKRATGTQAAVSRKKTTGYAMPPELVTTCLARSVVGMLVWWLRHRCPQSARELAISAMAIIAFGYVRAMEGVRVTA